MLPTLYVKVDLKRAVDRGSNYTAYSGLWRVSAHALDKQLGGGVSSDNGRANSENLGYQCPTPHAVVPSLDLYVIAVEVGGRHRHHTVQKVLNNKGLV